MSNPADRVIAEIRKNGRGETIRVSVGEFNGHRLASVRIWVMNAASQMVPTKSGVTFKVDLLPDLIAALEGAWSEAVQ